MNSKKALAFSAGMFVAGSLIFAFEYWCSYQIKRGQFYSTETVPALSVEELKKRFSEGIYPDPPPVIKRKIMIPPPQDLRHLSEQVYVPIPDTDRTFHSFRHIYKKKSGEVLWDIPFYFDKYKRRIVPADENKKSTHFVAMFGDSNIIGYGLKGEETLPNYVSLSLSQAKIYNYSGIGFYPYQILSRSERIDRTEEIPEKDGIAVYFYMSYHLRRNIAGMNEMKGRVVDVDENGDFVVKGTFEAEMPVWYSLKTFLSRSSIFQYFRLDLAPAEKDYRVQTAMIKKMMKNLKSNGINKFFVIIHPFQENLVETQTLMGHLHEAKIPFIYFGHWNMPEITDGPIHLVIDAHYSGLANEVLSRGVTQVLAKELKEAKP